MGTSILFSSGIKACARCHFGDGIRRLNNTKTAVECASSAIEGVCKNPNLSPKNKSQKAGYTSCMKFTKLQDLK